jgi:glycerol-3-phosphate acyltransferase PlsY
MISVCYVAGSIPTSIIVSKLLRGIDIRDRGSFNAGATNVYRVLGLAPAILVSAVDVGKGLVAVLVLSRIGEAGPLNRDWVQIIAGLAAMAGHVWTVFAGFRGGKGVNTAAGVLVALAPWATLIGLLVWLVVTFITRYVSVGSMSAAVALPVVLVVERFVLGRAVSAQVLVLGCVAGMLILITHRSNIARLLRGEENRFGRPRRSAT